MTVEEPKYKNGNTVEKHFYANAAISWLFAETTFSQTFLEKTKHNIRCEIVLP